MFYYALAPGLWPPPRPPPPTPRCLQPRLALLHPGVRPAPAAPSPSPWQPADTAASARAPPPGRPADRAPPVAHLLPPPAAPPGAAARGPHRARRRPPPGAPAPPRRAYVRTWRRRGVGGTRAPAAQLGVAHRSGRPAAAGGAILVLVGLFTAWLGPNVGDETITGRGTPTPTTASKPATRTRRPGLGHCGHCHRRRPVLGQGPHPRLTHRGPRGGRRRGGHPHPSTRMDIADIAQALPVGVEITAQFGSRPRHRRWVLLAGLRPRRPPSASPARPHRPEHPP